MVTFFTVLLAVFSGRTLAASFSLLDQQIVGGHDAPLDSAPYQAALYLNEEFYCSAVLLSQRTVITAAQCIRGFVLFSTFFRKQK